MRAFDILLFLMAFNAALWIMGSMGMFGEVVPGGSLITPEVEIIGVKISGVAILTSIAGAIVVASITVLGTRVTRPIGVVVTAFTGLYIFMFANAFAVLYTLHLPTAFLAALTGFNIFIFVIAIMQMVSGGWRTYR